MPERKPYRHVASHSCLRTSRLAGTLALQNIHFLWRANVPVSRFFSESGTMYYHCNTWISPIHGQSDGWVTNPPRTGF